MTFVPPPPPPRRAAPTKAVIQLTNPSTARLAMTLPRPDGPTMCLVEPGETVEIDVTEMVWPNAPPAPPPPKERHRADGLNLGIVLVLGLGTILLVAREADSFPAWVVVTLMAWGWTFAALDVWRASR